VQQLRRKDFSVTETRTTPYGDVTRQP
jgi:hypothetical protein